MNRSTAAEAVVTLGAGGEIVGITDEVLERSNHLPGLMGKQVIKTSQMGEEIDYELIEEIASAEGADPSDLLVIGFSGVGKGYGSADAEKKLTPFGIRNVGLDFYQPENLSKEMTSLGVALDRESEASELITFGNGSGLDDLVRLAGGRNIAENLAKTAHIAWEWVLSENPDVIVRTIMERPGTKEISAAKTGNVFIVYSDMLYGMESVAGLAYLAKILHPEADINPEIIYSEYFERLGLDFPDNRTFVYKEE